MAASDQDAVRSLNDVPTLVQHAVSLDVEHHDLAEILVCRLPDGHDAQSGGHVLDQNPVGRGDKIPAWSGTPCPWTSNTSSLPKFCPAVSRSGTSDKPVAALAIRSFAYTATAIGEAASTTNPARLVKIVRFITKPFRVNVLLWNPLSLIRPAGRL